jgi:hypothetical protein
VDIGSKVMRPSVPAVFTLTNWNARLSGIDVVQRERPEEVDHSALLNGERIVDRHGGVIDAEHLHFDLARAQVAARGTHGVEEAGVGLGIGRQAVKRRMVGRVG